jgi:hypothetical protein
LRFAIAWQSLNETMSKWFVDTLTSELKQVTGIQVDSRIGVVFSGASGLDGTLVQVTFSKIDKTANTNDIPASRAAAAFNSWAKTYASSANDHEFGSLDSPHITQDYHAFDGLKTFHGLAASSYSVLTLLNYSESSVESEMKLSVVATENNNSTGALSNTITKLTSTGISTGLFAGVVVAVFFVGIGAGIVMKSGKLNFGNKRAFARSRIPGPSLAAPKDPLELQKNTTSQMEEASGLNQIGSFFQQKSQESQAATTTATTINVSDVPTGSADQQ